MEVGTLGREEGSSIESVSTATPRASTIRSLTFFLVIRLPRLTGSRERGCIVGNLFLLFLSVFLFLESAPASASGTVPTIQLWCDRISGDCTLTSDYAALVSEVNSYNTRNNGTQFACSCDGHGWCSWGDAQHACGTEYRGMQGGGVGCPANSTMSSGSCTCNNGYVASGTECVLPAPPPPPPTCSAPSVLNLSGTACECLSPNFMNGTVCTAPPPCPFPGVLNAASCLCLAPKRTINGVCTLPFSPPPKTNSLCDCEKTPSTKKPIAINTGNKWLIETDVVIPVPGISFQRYYNSSSPTDNANLGVGWGHTYARAVGFSGNTATVFRPEGRSYSFDGSQGYWLTDADIADRLYEQRNRVGERVGWQYYTASDEVETYNLSGQLISIVDRAGVTQSLTYSDNYTLPSVAQTAGLLIRVADSFGRYLSFTYNSSNRIQTMTDSSGSMFTFAYSTEGDNNLISVTYPDGKARQYMYNESVNMGGGNFPNALTGIIDENGSRYMTYKYNSVGKAVEELSPTAGSNVNHTVLSYTTDASGNPASTVVTDALGASRTYNFTTILGVPSSTGQTQPAGSGYSASATNLTYDANGNVASHTDFNGNTTCYAYDLSRNLETVRLEGVAPGTACPSNLATYVPSTTNGSTERKATTTWSPSFRLPASVAEPMRITTYSYDSKGNLLTKTVQPTNDATGGAGTSAAASGTARTTTYTYNSVGQVLTVNGPRTDVSDITTYAYDTHGNLVSIANALGRVTAIGGYDANGRPGTITDPNGLVTSLSYDVRGRLISGSVGGEATTYTYDGVGNLTGVTFPGGAAYNYTYDAAHRLTQISDAQGNRLVYTLDDAGNRTKEELFDTVGVLVQTRSRAFDALSRLQRDIGAANQTTTYTYDANGDLTSVTDPLNRQTSNVYDALNRVTQVTNPDVGVVHYGYDGLDQLAQVIDPRTLTTSYTRDGLGNLMQTASPDTGTTTATYDAAGNLKTRTNTKGLVASYTYDALNRVTGVTYVGSPSAPFNTLTVTYQYDQGTNGIGHLTGVTDTTIGYATGITTSTGTTSYSYDQHGRLINETLQSHGAVYTTAYAYDAQGRLSAMTYPSGRTVNYTLDSVGRVNGISTSFNGNDPEVLLSNITYRPFGGLQSLQRGTGGQAYARQYDQDGRIASYTLNGTPMAIGYDAASQVSFIADPQNVASASNYSYDPMGRLSGFTQGASSQSYGYDLDGNRTTQTVGATVTGFTYDATSNWLTAIQTGGLSQSVSLWGPGLTISDSTRQYTYDVRGRLVQASTPQGFLNYEVNALGLRVRKQVPYASTDTMYHYDAAGHLIGEGPTGSTQFTREYIYLGDIPVAVMQ